ncbi:MAG TPA: hypothetical protein VI299_05480 [Polyangiales bacterium]
MSILSALGARAQEIEAPPPTVAEPAAAEVEPREVPTAAPPPSTVARPVVIGQLGPDGKPGSVVPSSRALSLSERLLLRQQWMMYREHDRRAVKIAGPSVGLTLGVGALGVAGWLLAQDEDPRKRAGALMCIFSVAALTTSVWMLVKRVKKRRAIEREIWGATPISSAPLSWRF